MSDWKVLDISKGLMSKVVSLRLGYLSKPSSTMSPLSEIPISGTNDEKRRDARKEEGKKENQWTDQNFDCQAIDKMFLVA